MIGVVAGNRRRSAGGGGEFTTIAALFAAAEKGGYWDFTDGSKLAINADGSGGAPAVGGTCKWAVDQSPNANHLRNTAGSVIRRANGIETIGTNYGLFNFGGFGGWPSIAAPYEIWATFEQINYAGADSRIIGDSSVASTLLQGSTSGKLRFLNTGYWTEYSPGLGVETTFSAIVNGASSKSSINGGPLNAESGSGALDGVLLGSATSGNGPQIRFKRLLIVGRSLSASERSGVFAWVSA